MSRREKLVEMLQADPDDPFLHYALALEDANAGENALACDRLRGLIGRSPDYVAAYFRLGQLLAEMGENPAAREIVTTGIEVAKRVGDGHAAGEMQGFLETL